MKFKTTAFILLIFATNALTLTTDAQNANMKVQYKFNQKANTDSIVDETGNGYNGKLYGSAKIKQLGSFGMLEIGSTNGYADLGAKTGNIISTLTDFSISTYLYIDPSLTLTNNGNFVWTFSNAENILASATGCMFYSAKSSRYAISLTNYSNEKQVNINSAATKGSWKHITYRQSGSTGEIYINGVLTKSGTVSVLPSALGATSFNYLAKPCYSGDQYLLNSKLCDFRIYNTALTQAQIAALAVNTAKLDTLTFGDLVDSVKYKLTLGDLSAVTTNLTLPTADGDVTISWASSNASIISTAGVVNRPLAGSANVNLTQTATITKNFVSKTKVYNATVLAQYTNTQSTTLDAGNLTVSGNVNNLRSNLQLATAGNEGSTITWSSDKPTILSNAGAIVNRPAHGTGKQKVVLTATISKGGVSTTKTFDIYVAEDEGFAAYLFAYFTGNNISQEAIRFALSDNGLVYKALNGDQPIIASSTISLTGGVRDPHIMRTENGQYYMVVTDMVSANGWNSNRGLILMKSSNLTDWTSTAIHIPSTYPADFSAVDRVWAPQTIYDPAVGKYMVYFSMRKGSTDYDKVYYAYANSTFTALESAPKLLFANPQGTATIDGDIIEKDGQFHLFFKTEGSGNGIKKAVASSLTGTWTMLDKYLDQNSNAVEGGCVFRLYNTDSYILMYDVYTSGYYEFTQSTDLENFSVISGNSFDFTPRHGTIIPITATEKQALNNKWGNSTGLENTAKPSFSISLNQINNELTINGADEIQAVNLFDIHGRRILNSNQSKISLPALAKGVYLVRVTDKNHGVTTQKIIIR